MKLVSGRHTVLNNYRHLVHTKWVHTVYVLAVHTHFGNNSQHSDSPVLKSRSRGLEFELDYVKNDFITVKVFLVFAFQARISS